MHTISRGIALAVILSSLTASAQMLNDQGPPKFRFIHRQSFAARYNPLGLFYDGRFVFRMRLYESDSVALRDNFIGFGIAPMLSPAFGRVGPYIEFAPATFLTLYATYTFTQYFGTFNLMQSFASANQNYGDAQLATQGKLAAGDPQRNYAANGGELIAGADLQFKVKNFIIRSRNRIVRPDMNLRAGDTVFYDQTYDILLPNKGIFFTTDNDALYSFLEGKLIAGARFSANAPFYDARHFLPNEGNTNLNTSYRVGPLVSYTFFSKDGERFNNPMVFLLLQWQLQHRFRAGQEISQALPLIAAGFQFTGDFLPLQ